MKTLRSLFFVSMLLSVTPTKTSEAGFFSPHSLPYSSWPITKENTLVSIPEVIDFYVDCDSKNYSGKKPVLRKTYNDIISGVKKRKDFESTWTEYIDKQSGIEYLSMHDIDSSPGWKFPIARKNHFENSFTYTRIRAGRWREKHNAIDIFAKVGSEILSPVSGLVIASADDWKGSYTRRKGFSYESGGLGPLAGNGTVIFSSRDTSYFYLIHMKDVRVKAGDLVSKGEFVGTVGTTGNAIYPYIPTHLHIAHKKPGKRCGVDGVLVSQNPYWGLVKAKKGE